MQAKFGSNPPWSPDAEVTPASWRRGPLEGGVLDAQNAELALLRSCLVGNLPVVNLDADSESADWTKQSWDLPPYRSAEFMSLFPDLDAFRKLPVYQYAVESGLILDDEWLAD